MAGRTHRAKARHIPTERVVGELEPGFYGEGCRWYQVTITQAGLGSLFPGKDYEPVYAKRWLEPPHGVALPFVLLFATGEIKCREIFHVNLVQPRIELGPVAEYQRMIERAHRLQWGTK